MEIYYGENLLIKKSERMMRSDFLIEGSCAKCVPLQYSTFVRFLLFF